MSPRHLAWAALLMTLLATTVFADSFTITNPLNFRDHTGPNTVGLPVGDLQQIGAFVTPSGPGTIVTALQGSTLVQLISPNVTIFPDDYEAVFAFDPSLTGAWIISATDGIETTSVATQPISLPALLPLVNNLSAVDASSITTPDILFDFGTWAAFKIPTTALSPGTSYIFRVGMFQLNGDGSTMNRSATFTRDSLHRRARL